METVHPVILQLSSENQNLWLNCVVHALLYMSIVGNSHPAPLSKKLEAEWKIHHSIYDGDIDTSCVGTYFEIC